MNRMFFAISCPDANGSMLITIFEIVDFNLCSGLQGGPDQNDQKAARPTAAALAPTSTAAAPTMAAAAAAAASPRGSARVAPAPPTTATAGERGV
jgi:hypothetical protein